MNNWKFEIFTGDILPILEQIMNDCVESHVFYHPALVKAWLDTYNSLRSMKTMIIRGTSVDKVSILPLVLWNKNWKNAFVKSVVPIGFSDFDYHDPITNKPLSAETRDSYWSELTAFLQAEVVCDEILLDGITDRSINTHEKWQRDEICPLLDLSEIQSEDELMAFFKTSLRGDIRRQIRRLSEIGELCIREYASWDEIPQSTFSEFMHQHSMRWPKAYKAPHLHENLLKEGLKAGVVHFSTLSVGNTEIAWHLGFNFRHRYYYYMPTGNHNYFKYSPTKIHLYYLVLRAVKQGISIFDHLRGDETYKSGWSNGYQYTNSLKIKSSNITSMVKNRLCLIGQSLRK